MIQIQNGEIHIEVNSNNEKEELFISVPYDEGWKISLNGNEIEPEIYANCMMMIPLDNGDNIIEMKYSLPYFKISLLISIIGIFIFIGMIFYQRNV